jgi:hypothetical protein
MISDKQKNVTQVKTSSLKPGPKGSGRKKQYSEMTYDHHIGGVSIRPSEQSRMLLGNFVHTNPPKGFAIHVHPTPKDNAVKSLVTPFELGDNTYDLVLHISNHGSKIITAEVWQL